MSDLQEQVQAIIGDLVASGAETGLQVAVYQRGECVVDAAAGTADAATGRALTSDTPIFSFSIGKGLVSTTVAVLAEEGLLSYDAPIGEVWPEFAAHGKHNITLRHVLSQSAGLPGLPPSVVVGDLTDWDKMAAVVADERPWWPPGEAIGYHAVTFGYIVGEVVRRVTGKRISEVARELVASPLGVADELFLAARPEDLARLAVLSDAPTAQPWDLPPDSPVLKLGPQEVTTAPYANRPDVLQADIPAGGTTTARAVARMYAALLGEVDGTRLVSPARLMEISSVQAKGTDQVFGFPTAWGLGFSVGSFTDPTDTSFFGVGGIGGSHAGADKRHGVSVAITKTLLTPTFDTAATISSLVHKYLS